MPKARSGTLQLRKTGWFARLTLDVDGETIRKWFDLETTNKAVAERKLKRLVAAMANQSAEELELTAKRAETYAEASDRVAEEREQIGVRDTNNERIRDAIYVRPHIGHLEVSAVRPAHIKGALESARAQGRSAQTLRHIRRQMNVVFDVLWREEVIAENPVSKVRVPKGAVDRRERAVLLDEELACYLAWEHPEEKHREAARERQTLACVSRLFGGLRTGDLHALRWDAFDTAEGEFKSGWAPRRKTARPQLLEIPDMLRPILRDWWERLGRPTAGLVFPARKGKRLGEAKQGTSHAKALRRDLKRALGLSTFDGARWHDQPEDEYTPRQRELFTETEHTKPVDFHSFRRAYTQALADAEVNAQHAAALAGHASLDAHVRYLVNTSKMRRLPEAALPKLGVSSAPQTIETQAEFVSPDFSRARQDSNLRPSAPEADALSS